ncbi:MAG: aspartate--tRNA ligase [Thermoanaerobaculia bacterium]|nr:aspartate--tRNA ligase [Thermoanaerobaculia bacterium]
MSDREGPGSQPSGRYRTAHVGGLTEADEGGELRLAGRVSHLRDHGGVIFAHLADGSGELQVRFNPETFPELDLSREDWVTVRGSLEARPEGTENVLNPDIALAGHELVAAEMEVLGRPLESLDRLPSLEDPVATGAETGEDGERRQTVSEELLLRYRPFALRRGDLQRAIRARSRAALAIRSFLEGEGFCEIETPVLAAPAPEGARDFLVPSRLHPGEAYALPQSPQIYKQLLMVGGFDRYFQVSRCFRDEDLRTNRQPEFTQIDLEMSFVEEADVLDLVTRMMGRLLDELADHLPAGRPVRFSRLTYPEAKERFGTDAPDLRIPLELADLSEVFRDTSFQIFRKFLDGGGAVVGIPVPPEARLARNEIDRFREWAKAAKMPQPAWGDKKDGEFVSTIGKFFGDDEKAGLAALMEEGGQIFFAAAMSRGEARAIAGQLRTQIGRRSGAYDLDRLEFAWITGFPAFERHHDGSIGPAHHPFTDIRLPEDPDADDATLLALPSRAYDLVLNGEELGSGSIRIHRLDKQLAVLALLGYDRERAYRHFRHLLDGLSYGAPPHGGIALGFDRLIANLLGLPSIRQTIAFPKDGRGRCLISDSPAAVAAEDLEILGLARRGDDQRPGE